MIEPAISLPVQKWRRFPVLLVQAIDPLTPFVIALLVGALVLLVTGRNVLGTYSLLATQALGGETQIANTLADATPILFTGLATAIAFRAGVFNVGVEGSLYIGAFTAAWIGFTAVNLPGALLVIIALLAAALAGLGWALFPGIARAQWGVNEVVTTLMLNYVATLLTSYLVNYHFLARGVANSMSPLVARQAQLGALLPSSQLTVAFPAALLLMVLYAYFFRNTTLGYELRMAGLSPQFARASGINLNRTILVAMLLSGAIGGIAGGFHVLGVDYRFIDNFSPGYGFTGIAVALLGRNHPIGIVLASLFFGVLSNGGAMIQLFSNIPIDLINILQGTIMIFAVIDLLRLPAFRRVISRA
jgi:ABC-type uncharacterized transport system permease subunit